MISTDFNLDLNRKKLYHKIGYRRRGEEKHKDIIENCLEKTIKIAKAGCVYNGFSVKWNKEGIYVADKYMNSSFLSKKFKGYNSCMLFVCTAGFNMNYTSGDMLEQLIHHSIGAEMAESIAAQINKRISVKYNLGEVLRWSPGYNDWDLTDQKKIFDLLKPSRIGVTLTDSYMMKPEFSVSAIIRK